MLISVALLLALTLLPALLTLLQPRDQGLEVGWRALKPVDDYLLGHRKTVLWAFVGAMAASIALLPFVRFDFNPFHLRDPRGEAMSTLSDLFRDPQENPNTIDVLAPSVPAADALARRIDALPHAGRLGLDGLLGTVGQGAVEQVGARVDDMVVGRRIFFFF